MATLFYQIVRIQLNIRYIVDISYTYNKNKYYFFTFPCRSVENAIHKRTIDNDCSILNSISGVMVPQHIFPKFSGGRSPDPQAPGNFKPSCNAKFAMTPLNSISIGIQIQKKSKVGYTEKNRTKEFNLLY